MKLAYLRWVVPAVICITLSGPAFAAASLPTSGNARTPATATSTAVAAQAPVAATSSEAASYAQREQASQQLEQFRGGASIYIGGSALVIVLLIVLLVLLL